MARPNLFPFIYSSGKSISELQAEIPQYHMIKDKIMGTQEQAYYLIRKLKKKYWNRGEISLLDGLKIQSEDHWFHIRPSNTEPIIRLIAEAKSHEQAKRIVSQLKSEISGILRKKS